MPTATSIYMDAESPIARSSLATDISAIAHFSCQPFPHEDIYRLVLNLIPRFPAERIVIGSDYPFLEKAHTATTCAWRETR